MSSMANFLKDRIESITRDMVDSPESVDVNVSISTKAVIVQIKVAQNDCGKIIGKAGSNIDALKRICLAIKNTQFPEDSRRVMLEVLEDENSSFSYR